MTPAERLWLTTDDHPRDLMELLGGDLLAGRIDRKWRLWVCAAARRVVQHVVVPRAEAALDASERWADGTIEPAEFERVRRDYRQGVPGQTSMGTRADHAAWAVSGTLYDPGYGNLFDATLHNLESASYASGAVGAEDAVQALLLKDVFGNPFRPVAFDPDWRTPAAVALARTMYDARDFAHLPILADALDDAGCDHPDIIDHLRGPGPHARGCWVVDLVLNKS